MFGWGWDDWKERFFKKMGGKTGVDVVCRRYIIREIKPQGWAAKHDFKTDEERMIYSVPLHGPRYDTDNRAVLHEIQNCCIGTTEYDWIK